MEPTQLNPASAISMPIDTALLIIFLLFVAGYIIFSIILHYHWRQYSSNDKVTTWTFISYAATTIPPLIIMGITALTA